jgi:tryptophan halogenase
MNEPIKKIVIVGRDADAWITALMLQLGFRNSESPQDISLVELPSRLTPLDFYSVLPSHKLLHKIFRIDESILFRGASAQYCLGTQFSNWSEGGKSFFHGYDTHGTNFHHVDFFQCWIKAFHKGLNVPLEGFSLGVEAAKQGRFVDLTEGAELFSKATYGFNMGSASYLKLLANAAIKAGLKHVPSQVKSVEVREDKIVSVLLDNQITLEADLFIDASGSEAVLIHHLEQRQNYESWRHWFPCDKKVLFAAPPLSPPPSFNKIEATRAGWLGYFPLLNRTGLLSVYSSEHTSLSSVVDEVVTKSGLKFENVHETTLDVGMRHQQWIGNCIAIGESAVSLDLIDSTQLHILHLGLSLLRSLMPNSKDMTSESIIFNEKMQSYAVNARDFQITHYKLNKRAGSFWQNLQNMEIPKTLKTKLDLFAIRGQVSLNENETFQEENWRSILVGHGLVPKTYNPLVDNISIAEHIARFQQVLEYIASEVKSLPSIQSHIELNSTDNEYHSLF